MIILILKNQILIITILYLLCQINCHANKLETKYNYVGNQIFDQKNVLNSDCTDTINFSTFIMEENIFLICKKNSKVHIYKFNSNMILKLEYVHKLDNENSYYLGRSGQLSNNQFYIEVYSVNPVNAKLDNTKIIIFNSNLKFVKNIIFLKKIRIISEYDYDPQGRGFLIFEYYPSVSIKSENPTLFSIVDFNGNVKKKFNINVSDSTFDAIRQFNRGNLCQVDFKYCYYVSTISFDQNFKNVEEFFNNNYNLYRIDLENNKIEKIDSLNHFFQKLIFEKKSLDQPFSSIIEGRLNIHDNFIDFSNHSIHFFININRILKFNTNRRAGSDNFYIIDFNYESMNFNVTSVKNYLHIIGKIDNKMLFVSPDSQADLSSDNPKVTHILYRFFVRELNE
jgi:hypothetical protein